MGEGSSAFQWMSYDHLELTFPWLRGLKVTKREKVTWASVLSLNSTSLKGKKLMYVVEKVQVPLDKTTEKIWGLGF